MQTPEPDNTLEEVFLLADLMLENKATWQDLERLEELLEHNQPHRQEYLEYIDLNAALREFVLKDNVQGTVSLVDLNSHTMNFKKPVKPWSPQLRLSALAFSTALTVLLLMLGVTAWFQLHARFTQANPLVAFIEKTQTSVNSQLKTHTIRLNEKFENLDADYTIRFDSGVVMEIGGPVSLQFTSRNSCRLFHGQVVADVPPSGHGFTIHTQKVDLIDKGTKIGVDVTKGARLGEEKQVSLHVFEGAAAVQNTQYPTLEAKQIVEGFATSIVNGNIVSTGPADPSLFVHLLPRFYGITQISGNISFLPIPPQTLEPKVLQSNNSIFVIPEARNYLINAAEFKYVPSSYIGEININNVHDVNVSRLIQNEKLDSLLLHIDQNQNSTQFLEMTFDRPILGVVLDRKSLRITDSFLGNSGTMYPTPNNDVDRPYIVEAPANKNAIIKPEEKFKHDFFYFDNHGYSIHMNFQTTGVGYDQVRILFKSNK